MPRSRNSTMANLRLQRRHYQFIADTIAEYRLASLGMDDADIASWFADRLRGTNPGFDRTRFIVACGDAPTPKPLCLLCQSEQC